MTRSLCLLALLGTGVGVPAAVVHILDAGRYHLGDGHYTHTWDYEVVDSNLLTGTHLAVPFNLSGDTAVRVRIDRLWGVGGQSRRIYSNFVYLDNVRVGRITPGHREPWQSQALRLRRGNHRVVVTSQGDGDRDDYVIESIRVVTADAVRVSAGGPSRIWTDSDAAAPTSALGATSGDISAWLDIAAASWQERQRERLMEQSRQVLAGVGGMGGGDSEPVEARSQGRSVDLAAIFAAPEDLPSVREDSRALRITGLSLDPPGPLEAAGPAPTVRIDCHVDLVFAARGATATARWRWLECTAEGDLPVVGGGPSTLGRLDRSDPRLMLPLPLAPPSPGDWVLEVAVTLGEFGSTGRLMVTAE